MASVNIIDEVIKKAGSEPLPKIDPNTQAAKEDTEHLYEVGNASLSAVLVGFYEHTRHTDDAENLLHVDNAATPDFLFGENKGKVTVSVAKFAGVSEETAGKAIDFNVNVLKKVLHEHGIDDGKKLHSFFTDQRSNILKHLAVELNMGDVFKDNSLDDRTNKMEGPMTGIMHKIEKIFSSTK